MSTYFWNNYGVVAYIADKVSKDSSLGKTKLQKLIYFIKVIKKIKVGYDYKFYNYGPYSSELAGDLDYLQSQKVINITYDQGFNSYYIEPGEKGNDIIGKINDFLSANKLDIDEILEKFGKRQAKDLELLATVVFYTKAGIVDNEKLINAVRDVKPKFSGEEVKGAITELKTLGYI